MGARAMEPVPRADRGRPRSVIISEKIYAALAAVANEIEIIQKNGWNDYSKYHYAKVDDVCEAVRGKLARHGVVFRPNITRCIVDTVPTKRGETQAYASLEMEMAFIHTEDNSTSSSKWFCEAIDTGDKVIAKAISAGVKSFLKAALLLSTGDEDPDETSPERVAEMSIGGPKREPVAEWSDKNDQAIRKLDKFASFRQMCEDRGHDPCEVAKGAHGEGIVSVTELEQYAQGLPPLGPIEVSTIETIAGLFEDVGVEWGKSLSAQGKQIIAEALGFEKGETVPAVRKLNEHEGQKLILHLRQMISEDDPDGPEGHPDEEEPEE